MPAAVRLSWCARWNGNVAAVSPNATRRSSQPAPQRRAIWTRWPVTLVALSSTSTDATYPRRQLDKARPVLILTREVVRPHLANVTVAPITTTIRGLATEVPVGAVNGLNRPSVVSCDNIQTIPVSDLRRQIGYLLASQEPALADAICSAFDLDRVVA